MESVPTQLSEFIKPGKCFIFSVTYCPYCVKAKNLLDKLKVQYEKIEVDSIPKLWNDSNFESVLNQYSGINTYPKVYIGTTCIGGCNDMHELHNQNKLFPMLDKEGIIYGE